MKLTKATIVRNGGPDTISLMTDLPEAAWPFEEKLDLKFICRAGDGEQYLDRHFPGIPVEVIDVSGMKRRNRDD